MVNTELLEKAITKSGKKKAYLANCLGVSPQTFRNKTVGKYDFGSLEIITLCKELSINCLDEKEKIFFSK